MKRLLSPVVSVGLSCLSVWACTSAADNPAPTPDPNALMAQAEAALKAVKAVRYSASGEPEGVLATRYERMSGTVTMVAAPGGFAPKLRVEVQTTPVGKSEAQRLEVVFDGREIAVADHGPRHYVRNPAPIGLNLLGRVLPVIVREFVVDDPFGGDLTPKSMSYIGFEKVAGVACDVVETVLKDSSRVQWALGREDHLPRRVKRILNAPGGLVALTTTITRLDVNPTVEDSAFQLARPDGFSTPVEQPARGGREYLPVGSEAPNWTLKAGDGKAVSLKDLRGRVVLLDFWATWCTPCLMAMPGVQKLHERYKDKPVSVFGVNCWERNPRSDPAGFMKGRGFTYPVLLDGGDVAAAYRVTGIPTFYLIGPDGKILLAYAGLPHGMHEQIVSLIDEALAQTGRPGGG